MRFCNGTALAALIVVAVQGCGVQPHSSATAASVPTKETVAGPSGPAGAGNPTTRGYDNGVNRLHERRLKVTDKEGKPAVHDAPGTELRGKEFDDVQLKIVWTEPLQFSWNYCIPQLHGGKGLYQTEYPSTPYFLERKLGAKTFLEVSVPDTPYSFYIINGRVSPYFYDSKKSVIWHLKSMELAKQFRQMRTISASSKRIVFSPFTGDCAVFLVVDFSDRKEPPKVKYWIRYDGW